MQAGFRLTRNTISPDLAKKVKASANPSAALRGAGEVLVQMAKRAFDEPALRAAPWPALKESTKKASGAMWRSLRVIGVDSTRVTIGSDRMYAGFHQLGTSRLPARPFFPVTPDGKLTAPAKKRVEAALKIKLGLS